MEFSTNNGWLIFLIFNLLICLVVLLPLIPALVLAALMRHRIEQYRKNTNTIMVQYDAPHGFSPAEIGLLYDSVCDEKEIHATLFQLAEQKIIIINSKSSVSIIDQTRYDQLPEYAKIAVRMFDASTILTDKNYPQNKIYVATNSDKQQIIFDRPSKQTAKKFTRAVQQSLRGKDIITKDYNWLFYKGVLIGYVIAWCLPLAFTFFITGVTENGVEHQPLSLAAFGSGLESSLLGGLFLFPAYLLISYLAVKIFVSIAGRVWINSKQVRALWPELEGYRQFLKAVDLDNIRYESEDKTHDPVTNTLPYAMVFNLETKWRERLKS